MIIINLISVKTGGGLKQAKGFLETFEGNKFPNYLILITSPELAKVAKSRKLKYQKYPKNTLVRLFLDYILMYWLNPSLIFTLYGVPPKANKKVVTITGTANSQLFYPEIDFYESFNPIFKKLKIIKDKYRLKRFKKSNYYIFETNILKKRAIKLYNLNPDSCYVVYPFVHQRKKVDKCQSEFIEDSRLFKIIYPADAYPNKRHSLLIDLVKEIVKKNKNIIFYFTLDKSKYQKMLFKKIHNLKLENHIINLGHLNEQSLDDYLVKSDAVINFARLESFSNSYLEAWQYNKLLIVTDADWSREICLNSAIYIESTNLEKSASRINEYILTTPLKKSVLSSYPDTLSRYPNSSEKTQKYNQIISAKIDGGIKL